MHRGDQNKGFTLIEMMVVLAIIAIVITLSTPLSNLYRQNRVSTQVQEFVSALNTARSLAVSRGISVSVCIPDGADPFNCAVADGTIDWSAGWVVFTDNNSDCVINRVNGETVISEHNAMPGGFSLQAPNLNCISYTAAGITPATSGLWTMCDPTRTTSLKRGINLLVSGRAQIFDNGGIALAACPPMP